MPPIKVFTYAGKPFIEAIFIVLGFIGALIVLYGFFQPFSQIYYVIGAILLLVAALFFRLVYFIALELILLAGHGAILLGIGPILQLFLPILLCIQLMVFYYLSGDLQNAFKFIGIVGIALMSIGTSFIHIWIALLGSICVSIYAGYNVYEGKKAAIIWCFLNGCFVIITAYLITLS